MAYAALCVHELFHEVNHTVSQDLALLFFGVSIYLFSFMKTSGRPAAPRVAAAYVGRKASSLGFHRIRMTMVFCSP